MRAPIPISPASPGDCQIVACSGQAWVQLKTTFGLNAICLRHFQAVRDIAFRWGALNQQPVSRRPGLPG
jgi:hypothetical protein